MKAIKGIYQKKGAVKLLEPIDAPAETEVLVIFPKVQRERSNIYNSLKVKLEEKYPQLKARTLQQRIEDFERISAKMLENLQFAS